MPAATQTEVTLSTITQVAKFVRQQMWRQGYRGTTANRKFAEQAEVCTETVRRLVDNEKTDQYHSTTVKMLSALGYEVTAIGG